MRVLVWLESVGYGQAALGWYAVRALEGLGHEVRVLDYADYARPIPRTFLEKVLRRLRLLLGPHPRDRQMNRDLLEAVQAWKPHVLLVTKGNPILPRTLYRLREASRERPLLFNWMPDDPFHPRYASRALRASIPLYDVWLLPVRAWARPMERAGAQKTAYLPFACDPAVHRPIPLSPEERERWRSQVCFVGTGYPERAALLERLAEWALAVWGERWDPRWTGPRLRTCIRGGGIYLDDMARAYSGADIVLNIPQPQAGPGLNMRTFEALGCGAFLLDERKPEGLELFQEGVDWACYADADELVAQVERYLANPAARQRIAQHGQATAYARHTYRHRMAEVVALAESLL
ncbi:MAG: glycosyltransferase [Anaerolineae bacterium]|nr:glycosyltransferase [Anaerolineae bacterium]